GIRDYKVTGVQTCALPIFVGDGALRYPEVFAEVARTEFGETANAYPSAAALVELAHARALREEFVPVWELQPMYLRKADAEINRSEERRVGKERRSRC